MSAQHTPAPWACHPTFGRMENEYCQPFGVSHGTTLIAGCFGDTEGGEHAALANARLIAAAPDLLAALEGLLEGVYGDGYVVPAGAIATRRARAAIARARGEA